MILTGARVALSATQWERLDLSICGARIRFGEKKAAGPRVDLTGFLILPGLINAHDHLEFNLFPRLGRGPYPNAGAWAKDIYDPGEPPVCDHLKLPKPLRLRWGGIKNLLCGVTSVLHHNPWHPVFERGFPVRVIRRFGWSHSLGFANDVAADWARTPPGAPFLIHAGEGTDAAAVREVHLLDAAGVLRPETVVVHGVALDDSGIELMRARGAALVWCPTSNCFTLGATLPEPVLDSGIPIALGTDSALTAAGDLIDEIEAALVHTSPERLFGMLTEVPARVLRLGSGEGTIREGGIADFLVVRDRGQFPAEALIGLRPEIVLVGGRFGLVSVALAERLPPLSPRLHPLEVDGRGRFLVACDAPAMLEAARSVLGPGLRLAGKAVAA